MRKVLSLLGFVFVLALGACNVNEGNTSPSPAITIAPEPTPYNVDADPRLKSISDSVSSLWVAYPGGKLASRNINTDINVVAACNEPTWAYIFYDDGAVIGFEPFPEDHSITWRCVQLDVSLHNRDYPEEAWTYILVPPTPAPTPNTTHDPILAAGEFAFVLDDGTVVWTYTAENLADYDRVVGCLDLNLQLYNRDNDPDAHIVKGPRPVEATPTPGPTE